MSVDYDKISDLAKRIAGWERVIRDSRMEITQAEANIVMAEQSLHAYRTQLTHELGERK